MFISIAIGVVIGWLAGAVAGSDGASRKAGIRSVLGVISVGYVFVVGLGLLVAGVNALGEFLPYVLVCGAASALAYYGAFALSKVDRD